MRRSFLLPWFLHRLYGNCTADQAFRRMSPESKRKLKNRQPLVRFKPCFGRAVMVPLPLYPWYF